MKMFKGETNILLDKFENRDITAMLYAQFDSKSINLSKQNTIELIPRNITNSKPHKSRKIFAPYLLSQVYNCVKETA